ncbi:MAG: hypothetical protein KBC57_03350 [Neisseriaceae bacterium]|nr:hypothetical protein [Neisseriaceae bacterium]
MNARKTIGGLVLASLLLAAFFMFGIPKWNVWRQDQGGQAELAKAKLTKKIMVETAQAEKDAASLRADAIEIIGEAAQKYPEYRQQEFIGAFGDALRDGKISQVIYVPTEANIPILESGKRASIE